VASKEAVTSRTHGLSLLVPHHLSLSLVTGSKMAIQHFAALVLFSFLVSVVFGVISKDTPRQRLIYGAKSFGLFVGVAILLGWVMYALGR
jgi:uncharacterized membrane protein YagU involved in acid resistance